MLNFKSIILFMLLLSLGGCGHGYEGRYQAVNKSLSSLNVPFTDINKREYVVIGRRYFQVFGRRTTYDKIFVQDNGDKQYLILQSDEHSEAWTIIDSSTLCQNSGFFSTTLTRIL